MLFSVVLFNALKVLIGLLLAAGVGGPFFGMDIFMAHTFLLGAISFYALYRFGLWFCRPRFAKASADSLGK